MTTEFAAGLLAAGTDLDLVSAGPTLCDDLGEKWCGRTVHTGPWETMRDILLDGAGAGHIKLAEAKHFELPALWYARPADFAAAAARIGLPETSMVSYCDTRLDIRLEHRLFIADGQVAASSPYLWVDSDGSEHLFEPGFASRFDSTAAVEFGQAAVDAMHSCPPGWVLDVAELGNGDLVVLEANPAWSSGFYDADSSGVVRTVMAANSSDPAWAWVPDPMLKKAAKQRFEVWQRSAQSFRSAA